MMEGIDGHVVPQHEAAQAGGPSESKLQLCDAEMLNALPYSPAAFVPSPLSFLYLLVPIGRRSGLISAARGGKAGNFR